ncbi:hypothetical protein [Burkholderia sp. Nafp2/4-1b]|uniref:phage head spike fiber domain-containing protein n=1 Tax=Burkholderia sp. Nafp2/4-1b TaxID=2116686 RepID=UPI0013CEF5D0|nr:hypothetical protein [Burkholderia sp. Nafp2/4-1b]
MNGVISTPVQIGVGDGTTTAFDLVPNPGEQIAQVVIANIWRNDWQGNQPLSAATRTNVATNSQGFDKTSWTKNVSAMVPTAAIAPEGTNTAQKLTDADSTTRIHSLISNGIATLGVGARQCARAQRVEPVSPGHSIRSSRLVPDDHVCIGDVAGDDVDGAERRSTPERKGLVRVGLDQHDCID